MAGLLIAIFLGWAGGYRFYKKQIGLGVLYLLTFGLFGIGWLVDIFQAVRGLNSSPAVITGRERVMGAFAECRKDPNKQRKDVIESLSIGDPIILETAFYEGKPFFLVVDPRSGLDIGALESETSHLIKRDCPNAELSAVFAKKDFDYPEIDLTIKR